MKKYELTKETKEWHGRTLHRIRALEDFANVKAGELGGWIESEENLSRDGNAWVYDNARVSDNAEVYGNARVYDDAEVYGEAEVCGDAWVRGNAKVFGNARVYGEAEVCGDAEVRGDADISRSSDVIWFSHIGSRLDTTTIYRGKENQILVTCGCFYGTLEEFAEQVKETHGDSKYGKEYAAAIELAKIHFSEE